MHSQVAEAAPYSELAVQASQTLQEKREYISEEATVG